MLQRQFFGLSKLQKSIFDIFRWKLLLHMAVEWWEINVETCSWYEKYSSESVQYVRKKIRARNENTAGFRNVQQSCKASLKKDPCMGL